MRLAHAPLTTGSLMAKGDRVVAGVAFEQVRIGDTGMIVGPGPHALDNAARRPVTSVNKATPWQSSQHIRYGIGQFQQGR